MNIFLGNYKLEQIVKEEYVEQIQKFLDENGYTRTENNNELRNKEGNYHIYDMPRHIHICGEAKTQEFVKYLQDNDLVQKAFIGRIGIAPV